MLHAKFQDHRTSGSGKEDFLTKFIAVSKYPKSTVGILHKKEMVDVN